MLSRRSETARTSLFALDQLLLIAAYGGAVFGARLLAPGAAPDPGGVLRSYLLVGPVLALALTACGLYRVGLAATEAPSPRVPWLGGGLIAMVVLVVVSFFLGPATLGTAPPSRAVAFLFLALACCALWLSRQLLRVAEGRLEAAPGRSARLLVVGLSPRVLRLLAVMGRTSPAPLQVVGVAADEVPEDMGPRFDVPAALVLVDQGQVDHVLVDAEGLPRDQLDALMTRADREGVSVHITSPMFPSTRLVPAWERIAGVPVLGFVSAELPLGAAIAKRLFDVVVSLLALVLLALPMALVALLIRLDSPGPVLFVQDRLGVRGRPFRMFKFRTMRRDAEDATGPVFAVDDDPRCTRTGRVLRRLNLDELPQLVNVLRGEMSLVGPRPERPEFVRGFKQAIPRYAHRHWVKPGITGWAQVHGLRGARTSLRERVDHDLYYIENWSLLLDVRILVRTVFDGYMNAS